MTDGDGAEGAVETFSGGRFRPFDPRPADVRLTDIAAGLAHTCRFGGHCQEFYSVALHSLYVADEVADRGPRTEAYALLHDAGEAYLGDVPRPIKAQFGSVRQAEDAVLDTVWEAVGLPEPDDEAWAAVMAADDRLLAYEAEEILADGSWAEPAPDLDYDLRSPTVPEVRERFLDRVRALLDDPAES